MQTSPVPRGRVEPGRWAAVRVDAYDRDTRGVAIPSPEVLLAARFGPFAPRGFEVHAIGVRERVYRKSIRGGQRVVVVRLPLGAQEAVLGVSAADVAGRTVSLDELWGDAARRDLYERLGDARTSAAAAAILEAAIAQRLAETSGEKAVELAVHAASRLATTSVADVAQTLGVSERNLRRLFRDATGLGPKTFARLARFRRALGAARALDAPSWAGIALDAGYYDQAHLIADFRAIADVTPQALLAEMRTGVALG